MAHLYSKRKGKSSSKKVVKFRMFPWILMDSENYDRKKITDVIVELKKSGELQSKIGHKLRDIYGIPSSKEFFGKKLGKVLNENNVGPQIPEDIHNLMKKAVILRKHLAIHKKDIHNKRSLLLTESKVKRLAKYYIREKVLLASWKYEPEKMIYEV
ncbi:MAG: 30S ribosomal protein S15 [Candidatus Altarchaeum sp.]|nr:30S ribosomal protein S15 [Candidatus Altarchaeum sp.]